jgi:hypothetical protein
VAFCFSYVFCFSDFLRLIFFMLVVGFCKRHYQWRCWSISRVTWWSLCLRCKLIFSIAKFSYVFHPFYVSFISIFFYLQMNGLEYCSLFFGIMMLLWLCFIFKKIVCKQVVKVTECTYEQRFCNVLVLDEFNVLKLSSIYDMNRIYNAVFIVFD